MKTKLTKKAAGSLLIPIAGTDTTLKVVPTASDRSKARWLPITLVARTHCGVTCTFPGLVSPASYKKLVKQRLLGDGGAV